MAATDHFTSIDAFIANIKDEFASEKATLVADYEAKMKAALTEAAAIKQAVEDKLLAANIETAVHKQAADEARAMTASAQATTVRLIAQFDMVGKIFEEAKALALKVQGPATASALAKVDTAAEGIKPLVVPPGSEISKLSAAVESALGQLHHATGIPANMLGSGSNDH